MPELPEAENICRALDRALRGRSITRVEVFTPAMRTSLLPLKDAGLEGLEILGTRRRGRYVVADLSDGRALLMHFGMSGVVRVEGPEVPRRKHEHVFCTSTTGGSSASSAPAGSVCWRSRRSWKNARSRRRWRLWVRSRSGRSSRESTSTPRAAAARSR